MAVPGARRIGVAAGVGAAVVAGAAGAAVAAVSSASNGPPVRGVVPALALASVGSRVFSLGLCRRMDELSSVEVCAAARQVTVPVVEVAAARSAGLVVVAAGDRRVRAGLTAAALDAAGAGGVVGSGWCRELERMHLEWPVEAVERLADPGRASGGRVVWGGLVDDPEHVEAAMSAAAAALVVVAVDEDEPLAAVDRLVTLVGASWPQSVAWSLVAERAVFVFAADQVRSGDVEVVRVDGSVVSAYLGC